MVKTEFTTPRLLLESLTKAHAAGLFAPLQDKALYRYIPTSPPASVEKLEQRFAKLEAGAPGGREVWLNWAMRRAEDGAYVGQLEATVTDSGALVAYTVFPAFQRQGYASEGLRAVLGHLFADFHCHRVSALMDTRNEASIRLVESLGFKRVETIPHADIVHGEPSDEYRYELDEEHWRP